MAANSGDSSIVDIVVALTRISADQTDFNLVGLAADREIQSSWAVNSFASSLSLLDLESVRSVDSVDWQAAVSMRLLMFSGMEIMADMVEADGHYLVRLNANHPAAQVVDFRNDDIAQQAIEDVAKSVAEINQRVSGWAYGIEKYKFEAMVKTREEILKPLESS